MPLPRTAMVALITNARLSLASYAPRGIGTRRDFIVTEHVFKTNLVDFKKILFPHSNHHVNEITRIATNGITVDIFF